MTDTYTKLFASITESTIWGEAAGTRLVWITMLAKCNRHGEVFGSVPGLARLANVTLEECESAVQTLLAPDKWSRTPDHGGRRIEVINGGWRLLNHAKFDRMRSEAEAAEREAERKRAWDREHRASRPNARYRDGITPDVPPTTPDAPPTESDAPPAPAVTKSKSKGQKQQRDSKRGARLPDGWEPSDTVRQWAAREFPWVDLKAALEEFTDYWRGIPGQRGCNLDWDATFRNRVRAIAPRSRNANGKRSGNASVVERIAQNIAANRAARETRIIEGELADP